MKNFFGKSSDFNSPLNKTKKNKENLQNKNKEFSVLFKNFKIKNRISTSKSSLK